MGLDALASKVNWVDVLILILLLRISYNGFSRGFSSEVMLLLGVFAALIVSLHNYILTGQFIDALTPLSRPISNLLSFILLTVIIIFLSKIIRGFLMGMIRLEVVSFIERIGGLCLGALRATLTISLVLMIFVLMPIEYLNSSIKDRSLFGAKFLKVGPALYDKLARIFPATDEGGRGSMTVRFMN